MNEALNAVRFSQSSAFQDTKGLASKAAKRAMLRHLADLVRWSCAVSAYLEDRVEPKCDHSKCSWMCFQSELETADELSMSESAVKRTRRALVSEGWIKVSQGSIGRGAVTFYELNATKFAAVAKPKKQEKRCKLPPFLRTEDIDKGSNLPPLSVTSEVEGEQAAIERGAGCPEKGGMVPLLYKKNRIEPSVEPKPSASLEVHALESVFTHYLKVTGRSATTYTLTDDRRRKGLARLAECRKACGGDLNAATVMLTSAVDALSASDWHMGRDPSRPGKKYCEWVENLMKTQDQVQKWLAAAADSKPQTPSRRYVNLAELYITPEYDDASPAPSTIILTRHNLTEVA
jgi:hypothetical protein